MKKKSDFSGPKKRSLFDHVKHIRQVQSPSYYIELSDDERKSFNHFMILRALSMDADIVEEMAQLYQVVDKIPSAQFYKLLIAMVPKSDKFYPWVKSKKLKHNKKILEIVSGRFQIPSYQANEYVNILLRSEAGSAELEMILKSTGLSDKEANELLEDKNHE